MTIWLQPMLRHNKRRCGLGGVYKTTCKHERKKIYNRVQTQAATSYFLKRGKIKHEYRNRGLRAVGLELPPRAKGLLEVAGQSFKLLQNRLHLVKICK